MGSGVRSSCKQALRDIRVRTAYQAAVAQLLHLEVLEVRPLGVAQRVEDATRVAKLVLRQRVAREDGVRVDAVGLDKVAPAADLHKVHEQKLHGHQAQDVERQRGLDGRLVEEDGGVEDLLAQNAGHAQHRPPRVHQLRLAVPLQRRGVGAQVQRVIACAGEREEARQSRAHAPHGASGAQVALVFPERRGVGCSWRGVGVAEAQRASAALQQTRYCPLLKCNLQFAAQPEAPAAAALLPRRQTACRTRCARRASRNASAAERGREPSSLVLIGERNFITSELPSEVCGRVRAGKPRSSAARHVDGVGAAKRRRKRDNES